MTVIVIDATQMRVAAPRVTELHLRLTAAATLLSGLDLGVDMPPGVRARVTAQVNAARTDIVRGARGVEGLGAELAERARLTRLADTLGRVWMISRPLNRQLEAFADISRESAKRLAGQGKLDAARLQRSYQLRTERLTRGLGVLGKVVGLGAPTLADLRNPYLSTDQKIGRAAGRTATVSAVGGATKFTVGRIAALAGTRAAFAAGGPVGIGIGVAWTLLDYKFGLTPKIADGATWAVDKIGDGAQEFDDHVLDPTGDFIGDRAEDVADGADDVTPWDGVAPW